MRNDTMTDNNGASGKIRRWLAKSDRIILWVVYAVMGIIAALALVSVYGVAAQQGWTFMQRVWATIAVLGMIFMVYKACMWMAYPLVYGAVKAHHLTKHVRRSVAELDREIDELLRRHPVETAETAPLEMDPQSIDYDKLNRDNRMKNYEEHLRAFMATCEIERAAMRRQREAAEGAKLEKVLRYARETMMAHGFTDEELFQLNECVTIFVTERAVLSSPNIHIIKKSELKQSDIKNFAWNIASAYDIPADLTAKFVRATFPAWFANTEHETIRRTLRTTTGSHAIEIDPNFLSRMEES